MNALMRIRDSWFMVRSSWFMVRGLRLVVYFSKCGDWRFGQCSASLNEFNLIR